MRAFALVALVMLGYVPRSYAADDAPLAEQATGLRCYDAEQRANIARALESERARVKSLEADAGKVPVLPIIVTAVLALGAGFAIGFGVAKATAPKP
jgi:hypothetical protein